MSRITTTAVKPKSEIQIQSEAFQKAWNLYPATRYLIFAVPNGGQRNAIEGMQLKASGTVSGVPDIVMHWKGLAYGFEFKTETGTLSPAQIKVHEIWKKNETPVYVVRTADDFLSLIEQITGLKPLLLS